MVDREPKQGCVNPCQMIAHLKKTHSMSELPLRENKGGCNLHVRSTLLEELSHVECELSTFTSCTPLGTDEKVWGQDSEVQVRSKVER